jgi:hypothetical protein
MKLKEIKHALVHADLLVPENHCTGVYIDRDRQRLSHLLTLARWAKTKCEDICLDASIDVELVYKVLTTHLNFDCNRYKSLRDIMEALDDTPEFSSLPIDAAPELLETYCQNLNTNLNSILANEPWRENASPELFPEEMLICPEPLIAGDDS